MIKNQDIRCKHCGVVLRRVGILWHGQNEIVFPQYCKSEFPSNILHEPEEIIEKKKFGKGRLKEYVKK